MRGRGGSVYLRSVRLGGLAVLVYGLVTVAACAFLVAVGLDLHRRLGVGDVHGAPGVLVLVPLAICYGAVLAALGWAAMTASPGTAAAADLLAGGYALFGVVGFGRSDILALPAAITAAVAVVAIGAGLGFFVVRRLRGERQLGA